MYHVEDKQLAKKEKMHPFKVLGYLPGTNCKECGFATCLAFGVALMDREKKVGDCPYLLTEKYKSSHDLLIEYFGQELNPEHEGLLINIDKCIGCGDCIIVCDKAQVNVDYGLGTVSPRNVPPVFEITNGRISVINWSSCKRCTDPPGICKVCEERCAFDAIELV